MILFGYLSFIILLRNGMKNWAHCMCGEILFNLYKMPQRRLNVITRYDENNNKIIAADKLTI